MSTDDETVTFDQMMKRVDLYAEDEINSDFFESLFTILFSEREHDGIVVLSSKDRVDLLEWFYRIESSKTEPKRIALSKLAKSVSGHGGTLAELESVWLLFTRIIRDLDAVHVYVEHAERIVEQAFDKDYPPYEIILRLALSGMVSKSSFTHLSEEGLLFELENISKTISERY